ncbi:MAG TPA: orotate phosphoribosyltransferase [Rubrobacteraceae bacterium]|nr:orotate phosphoribosyltransferase [Rubrobacteraceae bacterium]
MTRAVSDPHFAALAARVREAALLEGDFVLSSGKKSSFYVDKYLFSTEPDLLRDLAWEISARLPAGARRLAGVELGAVPLVAAVALHTGLPYGIVRKSAKEYGTANKIEGSPIEAGEGVALIEDVVTTGTQVLRAAEVLEEVGAEVLGIVAVLDRRDEAASKLRGYTFEALLRMEDLGLTRGD